VQKGGIVGIDLRLCEQRDDVPPRQAATQLLLDQIADHAFALGAEHVERVGGDITVRFRL
jgi:hypothetical protein